MIEDSMGRPTGRLVGLTTDIKDEVTSVQVAMGNGEISQYPINFVRIVDGKPILLQTWRVEAEDLRREHDIIKRRSQALELLFKDGDIDQIEYNQQRSSYQDADKELLQKRESLLETLKQVEWKLDKQIRDLQTALTNNKMLFTASEIDEETYHTVTESIRAGLEIARKERKDIENIREYLHGIESLETPRVTVVRNATKPAVPDVVVIKMKESVES